MAADPVEFKDRMLSLGLARVSEAAAIASAKLIGSGNEKAADQAAVDAMRTQLNMLDIAGVVVIGEGERDEAPMLFIGEEVGSGKGPAVDCTRPPGRHDTYSQGHAECACRHRDGPARLDAARARCLYGQARHWSGVSRRCCDA